MKIFQGEVERFFFIVDFFVKISLFVTFAEFFDREIIDRPVEKAAAALVHRKAQRFVFPLFDGFLPFCECCGEAEIARASHELFRRPEAISVLSLCVF